MLDSGIMKGLSQQDMVVNEMGVMRAWILEHGLLEDGIAMNQGRQCGRVGLWGNGQVQEKIG